MNPFSYSLAEIQKTIVAFVSAAVILAGLFIWLDPGTEAAILMIVTALFGVIGVFGESNATELDVSKALKALSGAILTLVALYTTVSPDTGELIGSLVALLVPVGFTWWKRNKPVASGLDGDAELSQPADIAESDADHGDDTAKRERGALPNPEHLDKPQ